MLRRIFQSEAFRGPQRVAAALLLLYLLQCAWLVHVQTLQAAVPDSDQALRIYQGLQQWKGGPIAGTPESLRAEAATGIPSAARAGHLRTRDGYDQDRSPLYYLIAAAPLLLHPSAWLPESLTPLVAASPYLFFGVMLGASLWYVARRLYGNAGGYIVLAPLLFLAGHDSPESQAAQSQGEMGAVWGAFGSVFTAIAVAHTLYAPREVVLWNWRRILLLGLSIALAAGNQFSLALFALLILPLMYWVAPVRPRAVAAVWITAIAVGAVLLFAAYFFEPHLFCARHVARALDRLSGRCPWNEILLRQRASKYSRRQPAVDHHPASRADHLRRMETLALFRKHHTADHRSPSFSDGGGAPTFPGQGFHLTMIVFLFVYVAGIFADLLETQQSLFVMASLIGLLSASAIWNLLQLWRV